MTYVRLNGTVDESFDPQELLAAAKGQKVILNLRGITRLSSFGVREWTNAMRDLCASVDNVYLVEVSPSVVTQLNMVANFAGNAQVLSVQAPYYCDCGAEAELTIDLRGGEVDLPSPSCSECSNTMQFDDDPDAYFMYPVDSAKSRPVDPNIDVFLKHLSDSFQEEGSVSGSFAAFTGDLSGPSKISELPIPSLAPRPAGATPAATLPPHTYMGGDAPKRPGGMMANARSVLIGLAIPAVLAVAVLAFWPAGGSAADLPDRERTEYEAHVEAGRYGEAALLIRRLEREKKIDAPVSKRLKADLTSAALGPYAEHVEAERYADAAFLVTRAGRERVIPAKDATRLHKEVMERALARHRDLLAAEQFSAAEELAEGLAARDVLPTALNRSFQNDVALDRQDITQKLSRKAKAALEAERLEEALEASKKVARLGPMDADMTWVLAEAYRRQDRVEEAATHYANFIGLVENDDPPHHALDSALYWRAKYLASAGRDSEARVLFRRVARIPGSKYRDPASRALGQ